MTHQPSSPRRRGAPRGNTNALKHGFYSRRFRKSEMDDLESTNYTGLRDEIAMLRVCIRRIIEWGINIQDFPEALAFLRVVSLATAWSAPRRPLPAPIWRVPSKRPLVRSPSSWASWTHPRV